MTQPPQIYPRGVLLIHIIIGNSYHLFYVPAATPLIMELMGPPCKAKEEDTDMLHATGKAWFIIRGYFIFMCLLSCSLRSSYNGVGTDDNSYSGVVHHHL